jgi:hypothetical protein
MQSKQSEELRRKWGDKPCDHPSIDNAFDLSAHDGYVCVKWGTWRYSKVEFKKEQPLNGEV